MRHDEAVELIRPGVGGGTEWAELGAGSGTFTRALSELLGPRATIHAVDRKARAVRALRRLEVPRGGSLDVRRADFTEPLELPELDGILAANALHFVAEVEDVVERLVGHLRPGGRLLVVEYDRRSANPWVPHPLPLDRFRHLAREVGLARVREVGRHPSVHHREMYAAVARKGESPTR